MHACMHVNLFMCLCMSILNFALRPIILTAADIVPTYIDSKAVGFGISLEGPNA